MDDANSSEPTLYLKIVWQETKYDHDGYCSGPGELRVVNDSDVNPFIKTEYNKLPDAKNFLIFCGKYINRDMTVNKIPHCSERTYDSDTQSEACKRYGDYFKEISPNSPSFCHGTARKFISAELVRDLRSELYETVFGMSYSSFHSSEKCSAIQADILKNEEEERIKKEEECKERRIYNAKIDAERKKAFDAEKNRRKVEALRRRELAAKTKEINLATNKANFKKNHANTICPHFTKFGTCRYADSGRCWYKHE
jgi:hypothetical protein